MTTTDHTAIRQRTIPARIWRILASLNDMAGIADWDWSLLLRAGVVLASAVLAAHGYGGWAVWLLLAAMVVRR